jgi:UMF1 family MFS transporter
MNASAPIADLGPLNRAREQRAWYFTDWAASAFQTTVAGVLFAPYLISVAENAVGEHGRIHLLGLSIAPGSLPSYVITLSTVLSVFFYPVIGAYADRIARKPDLLVAFSWVGAAAAGGLFFMSGGNWLYGSIAFIVANLAGGAAIVVSDSILPVISTEDERDRVSSNGWAYGYAGGGLLLAVNFLVVSFHDALGLDKEMAVRLSLLSAAVWWAAFMVIPWRGIRRHEPVAVEAVEGGVLTRSFGQLWATLNDLRNYPVALTFLAAYLFFNDGIQTVINSASTFGTKELGFGDGFVLGTYLLVQLVGIGGAILFARVAGRLGAKKVILGGLDGDRDGRARRAREDDGAVPAARRRDRHRAGRHPGAGAVLLLSVHPARQGGGVLQPLPRDGPRHLVVRHAHLRPRLPVRRLLPTGDLRPHRVLRARRAAPAARRHRARHPRGRQRPAGGHLGRRSDTAIRTGSRPDRFRIGTFSGWVALRG